MLHGFPIEAEQDPHKYDPLEYATRKPVSRKSDHGKKLEEENSTGYDVSK